MSQTQTFILAIGGLQGFLLFVLMVSDKRVNYATRLLGIYCFLLAMSLVLPLIVSSEESGLMWLVGWLVFLPACFGSLSYLYCRVAITGSPLKVSDVFHFSPLLLCYLLNYEMLFSAEKALDFVRTPKYSLFTFKLTLTVFYGQALFYAALLTQTIYRYQAKARQTLSSYNPDTFYWHWSLAVFMVLIWALKALSNFTIPAAATVNLIADGLLVILIYSFAIVQWRNPSLFYVQQLKMELAQAGDSYNKESSAGLLDQEMRSNVFNLVQDQVNERALYRDSKLTLATLAEQVGVSVHHLSEVLNQHGGKNFNQFINEYRVADVCNRLDKKSDCTLIDLALDAGFSSKSSFNATFKRLTGKTPSQYREQLL